MTTFQFETASGSGAPSDGWFSLGYPNTRPQGFALGNFQEDLQGALDLVDNPNLVDFSVYNRFLVITNDTSFFGRGEQGVFSWWKVSTGIEGTFIENEVEVGKRQMTGATIHEWQAGNAPTFDGAASNVAHELGHNLGVRTHYTGLAPAPGFLRTLSPWGIMGTWKAPPAHFVGWAKAERDWLRALSPDRIRTLGPPIGRSIDEIVDLRSLSLFPTSGVYLIKIPFALEGPPSKDM